MTGTLGTLVAMRRQEEVERQALLARALAGGDRARTELAAVLDRLAALRERRRRSREGEASAGGTAGERLGQRQWLRRLADDERALLAEVARAEERVREANQREAAARDALAAAVHAREALERHREARDDAERREVERREERRR